MNSELSSGVDGVMLVFSHTLVHSRVLQGKVTDLKATSIHLHPVLRGLKGELMLEVEKERIKGIGGGSKKDV